MAQPATNAKIEELRFRIKTDPRSRHFFPLAEELRKIGRPDEAELVLRAGLGVHATYCAGWVSLGRVFRDQAKNSDAVEALTKALQLDPGNVVAARLMADAYFDLDEKVEAIKKYKLVHALLPSADEEVEAIINQLERDLHPPEPVPVAEPEPELVAAPEPVAEYESPFDETAPSPPPPRRLPRTLETPFPEEPSAEVATADAEPMSVAHDESPFEEPAADAGYGSDAFAVESPVGMHVEPAPPVEEAPAPMSEEAEVFAPLTESPFAADESPFASSPIEITEEVPLPIAPPAAAPAVEESPFAAEEPEPAAEEEDITETITMADLYARQGAVDDARAIYEHLLQRDPANAMVWEKLNALTVVREPEPEPEPEPLPEPEPAPIVASGPNPRIAKLQGWLARVARREASGV